MRLRLPYDRFASRVEALIADSANLLPIGTGPQPEAAARLRASFLAWMSDVERFLNQAVEPAGFARGLQTSRYIALLQDNISHDSIYRSIESEIALVTDQLNELRVTFDPTSAAQGPKTAQAERIRAWVELETVPPRLAVVNASDGPIRLILPTLYLLANPGPRAMVGGWLPALAELSPGFSFIWLLEQHRDWARDPRVTSQLHVDFEDEQGQRWQLGHGSVVPIDRVDPDGMLFLQGAAEPSELVATAAEGGEVIGASDDRIAFLSYVSEDAAIVDRLQADLEAAGITVWRDLDQLLPGDDFRDRIRTAIETQAFAFVPCFSSSYYQRDRTFMNEELSLAISQVRQMRRASWFIPVRVSECVLPELDLGLGRRLRDIVRADLFKDWNGEVKRLIASIQRLV